MIVVFRMDSSSWIGSGHVVRCLALARELYSRGNEIHFVSRSHQGNILQILDQYSYIVSHRIDGLYPDTHASEGLRRHQNWLGFSWEQDASDFLNIINIISRPVDWVVVDHYSLDFKWESSVAANCKIMVIDDLHDRHHDCDLLLNYSCMVMPKNSQLLTSNIEKFLLGPEYALIHPEYSVRRRFFRRQYLEVNRILIFFGGVDDAGLTLISLRVAEDVLKSYSNIFFDVVVGTGNRQGNDISDYCEKFMPKARVYKGLPNLSDLICNADLAIAAGGTNIWERCVLKLPSIVIPIAENQVEISMSLADRKAAIFIDCKSENFENNLRENIQRLVDDAGLRRKIGEASGSLVDGLGVCRVVDKMV